MACLATGVIGNRSSEMGQVTQNGITHLLATEKRLQNPYDFPNNPWEHESFVAGSITTSG